MRHKPIFRSERLYLCSRDWLPLAHFIASNSNTRASGIVCAPQFQLNTVEFLELDYSPHQHCWQHSRQEFSGTLRRHIAQLLLDHAPACSLSLKVLFSQRRYLFRIQVCIQR
jgi:hypothetical protein